MKHSGRVVWVISASLMIGLVLNMINFFDFRYQVAFNTSASVDGFIFLIDRKRTVSKGDLVAFYPPIQGGNFINNKFLKYVVGVDRDVVTVNKNNDFFINGEPLGRAKTTSKDGRTLLASTGGTIPKGFIFTWTPHPDSFDSRYQEIGLIHENDIIGRATRLL